MQSSPNNDGDRVKFYRVNRERGFTLIELLVSMGIAMVVLAAMSNTFISQTKFNRSQELINEMQQNARGAMDLMEREIKLAGFDPTGLAIANGIPYDTSKLQLLADFNGDQATDDANENIEYSFDAANRRINRTAGGVSTVLADNIANFTFAYFDVNGAAITSAAQTAAIRQIQVTITARSSQTDSTYTLNGGYRTYVLTSWITPQNLCYKGGTCP